MKTIITAGITLSIAMTWQTAMGDNVLKATINTNSPQQKVLHFGTSDAWSMQFIGNWDEKEQTKIADWLFSTENDKEGNPRGIGLSIWRFNLGAGSAEQGDEAQINYGTRTECMLRPDGTWDWTKQAAQRRFLKMAKERGVPKLLAFLNSPPVQFTQNGLATNTGRGGTYNLRDDCYEKFAQYMVGAVKGIEEHDGVHIDYLCPVNEPDGHWNWTGPKQEGSPATNREIARIIRATGKEMKRQKHTTQVMADESSDLRCLLGTHETSWERGYSLYSFFTKDSTDTYLGATPNVPRLMLAHSYWTNTPIPYMKEIRLKLRDEMKRMGVGFWQTEICIMGNDEEIGGGHEYDFSMKTALYVARVIHHDLVYANAESWSWWRAVGGNYRDGLLRAYTDEKRTGGYAIDSKLLWSLGNYSRFVRPEAVRHDVTTSEPEDPFGVMCSAYRNADGRWVAVVINYGEQQRPFSLVTSDGQQRRWTLYRTSDISAESLRNIGSNNGITTLAPRSITTFVEAK